ncbi:MULTISPECIES: hypothetical protein [unclassified Paenibacillus]|uniref:hypothetical protein n=1 Tax=unclassified Paenibacillus TaxID=185978 RepID=UPI002785E5EC|nr:MULTISPECIES: hypothetical protein [unclassified Paenibacillus]MDQ0896399.1 hypothetical protein [Paenibacillus sp. V4I7]MDQ0914057.1 hypothetical protein [Paenibacillus sp. V4I5]
MTSIHASWLSREERVEVVKCPVTTRPKTLHSSAYRAKRQDGSVVFIERKDILLEDEETLIEELARILKTYNNPQRSDRYSLILRQLMKNEVPFYRPLEQRMSESNNEQLLLRLK